MSDTDSDTDSDRIDRGNVRFVGGYKLGASRGKRDDQDDAIGRFAERLAAFFPDREITIRFNTNRLGGGAWLVDHQRNAQVGLGADLKAPGGHADKFRAYLNGERDVEPTTVTRMDPDDLRLRYTVKVEHPAAARDVCNRDSGLGGEPYARKTFDSFNAAWDWFTEHVRRDDVNPPPDD